MLKNTDKTKLYVVAGFVAGYYIGRRYDLKVQLEKAVK